MMNVNSVSNLANSERQMQSEGMKQGQLNDMVTKEIQTKLQGEEQKLKDLSYNEEMSTEEKSKKRKEIRKEISELNRELRQRQIELRQEKAKEAAQETKEIPKDEENDKKTAINAQESEGGKEQPGLSPARIDAMLSAKTGIEHAEVHTNVVMNIEHQVNVLDAEIQQDKARSQNVEFKEEQKKELEDIVIGSKSSRMDALNEVNEELKEFIKEEQKDGKLGVVKLKEIQEEQEERKERIRIIID